MKTFKQAFGKRAFMVIKDLFLCIAFLAFNVIMANFGLGLLGAMVIWLVVWLSIALLGSYWETIADSDGGW